MATIAVMAEWGTEDSVRLGALEQIMASEQRRLFHIALAITHDPGEAEDAVQDVFVTAWKKWDQIADPSKRRAWLTTICVRACCRRRLKLKQWQPLEEWVEVATPDIGGSRGVLMDLDRAQEKLSRQQRAVLRLCYRDGYSADECADLMGLSGGTVRSHLARALATLRKEMSDG